ncbi:MULTISPECIES: chemotaxis protein CheW [Pseudoalteromonas]|uniref:Chemotaxis protein CheW n=1 Tax=Pseudoalteromonas fuliginea TaxID=1872678 RepID=A0ABD3Y579_9GAMM|nr:MULTISPECIES: chemotaxis protein CheW [Pseudoalteromonas]ALQ08937.1 chemotaxis protein CheW [Pseudoalteromonas sp. Bsw20308]ATG76874.1 chemotaxis protein CheW [Pseudoalteromonas sp. 1_2015MBL_MicDiv]KAA1154051.1 chemotaxis protein CheW [Pseudoalteromonas fuliginea]KAA1166669.1 chemotaxis protein CheW [Pseudoalteromonas fuliginea]KDC49233.1 chemotaxis protein CheW [Pseudoalteromonas fuliginea]
MSKQLFANEKVMTQYLGALLRDDEPTDNLEPVAKLLEQIPSEQQKGQVHLKPNEQLKAAEKIFAQDLQTEELKPLDITNEPEPVKADLVVETSSHLSVEPEQRAVTKSQEDYFDGEFQALFFEVAGLTLAVPLKALGGIHQLGEVNHLFGKPKWFKGVMLNRDEKLNVVDTAHWVMPEKYDEKLEASLNYQYLITLGDSQWGLLAEKLINNITLSKEDVKWRTDQSKRPWLAGVIKKKMCALIDVDNLNALLEKGLDSRQ